MSAQEHKTPTTTPAGNIPIPKLPSDRSLKHQAVHHILGTIALAPNFNHNEFKMGNAVQWYHDRGYAVTAGLLQCLEEGNALMYATLLTEEPVIKGLVKEAEVLRESFSLPPRATYPPEEVAQFLASEPPGPYRPLFRNLPEEDVLTEPEILSPVLPRPGIRTKNFRHGGVGHRPWP